MDNVRLPDDVERGAQGGPGFKTTVITLASGQEQRNSEWSIARGSWNVGYGVRNRADMDAIIQFFYARRGRSRSFRFKDWLDFKVTGQAVAETGVATTRQLVARYGVGDNEYVRNIVLPIPASLIVYVDNVATENYTLGANGVLTFVDDPGDNVKATFEFDVPVRFDIDSLSVTLYHFDAGDIPNVPVVEVRS